MKGRSQARDFPIAILTTPGGEPLARVIDEHLKALFRENGEPCPLTFIRNSSVARFQNGEGKAVIEQTVRGTDLYIITDIGNYGAEYERQGTSVSMSPDEHFQDVRRLLAAAKNMPQRANVVMPLLYASRQHKISGRESLDCALALQDLASLNVHSIMTIDAHNSHVMNAIPLHGLENLHAVYQLIEAFLTKTRDQFQIDTDNLLVCSPDLGGMERARYYAEHFRVLLTGFYKSRDLTRVVNGKNPVLEHKCLASNSQIEGRNVLVIDDMLASGGSLLEVGRQLKKLGAAKLYFAITYALFSDGLETYDQAYEEGLFEYVFATNASYLPPDLLARPWFVDADVTPFIAKFIYMFNQDASVTRLMNSTERINRLLGRELSRRG